MKKKSFLDYALELAALGFPVIPVTPGKKQKPLREAFWNHASTDPEVIRRLWKCDPISGEGSRANPAISTTRFRDGALLALDVDPKHGGYDSLDGLRYIMGYDLPDTYEQHTPSGGRHYVYFVPKACAGSNGVLDRGLDIKSHHNYILGAGAQTAAGIYTCTVRPVAPAPDWLIQFARNHMVRKGARGLRGRINSFESAVDRRQAIQKAHAYLTKLAPAPDGRRDTFAYKAACKLRDFGLSQGDTAEQMTLWFKYDEGRAPFTADDIAHATESAFKYARGAAGEDAPESYFAPIKDPEPPESAPMEPELASPEGADEAPESGTLLSVLNRDYAFTMVGSKARVMWEFRDHHGKPAREFLELQAFKDKHAGEYMDSPDGSKKLELAPTWLRWRGRRSYDNVVFAPGQTLPSRFCNTWKGFAYEPLARGEKPTAGMKEALAMFLTHLRENFCAGIAAHAEYVTAFFAHMIQKPQIKPRVALVAKGGKGQGKSTIAQMMGALVEPHFFVAADQRSFLGNFNAHMGDTSFFVLEEAVWGGNKSAESVLKDLVTRGHINIEQKFREVFRADNYMRIMIIGNEDWQVPASLKDERRWAVFNVAMRSMPFVTEKDKAFAAEWFDRLYTLMQEGGYRYLLTYLQNIDLSSVNINAAPITEGLVEQIINTLSPLHQWWLECLSDGRVVAGDFGNKWPGDIEKERMRDAFTRYCDGRKIDTRRPGAVVFGRELHRVCPSIALDKKNAENVWIYRLPPLPVAREEWSKTIGRTPLWPDDEDV